jgi:hypothetical protein
VEKKKDEEEKRGGHTSFWGKYWGNSVTPSDAGLEGRGTQQSLDVARWAVRWQWLWL